MTSGNVSSKTMSQRVKWEPSSGVFHKGFSNGALHSTSVMPDRPSILTFFTKLALLNVKSSRSLGLCLSTTLQCPRLMISVSSLSFFAAPPHQRQQLTLHPCAEALKPVARLVVLNLLHHPQSRVQLENVWLLRSALEFPRRP